jgi:hypothetical protein
LVVTSGMALGSAGRLKGCRYLIVFVRTMPTLRRNGRIGVRQEGDVGCGRAVTGFAKAVTGKPLYGGADARPRRGSQAAKRLALSIASCSTALLSRT